MRHVLGERGVEGETGREGEEGAGLGSDVWLQEEELWCSSAAQISFSHKSLKVLREMEDYLCFRVSAGHLYHCLDKVTLD